MKSNYDSAVEALKKVKTVAQWNEVRAQYVPLLTSKELHDIDALGLIVKVTGRDKPNAYFVNKIIDE